MTCVVPASFDGAEALDFLRRGMGLSYTSVVRLRHTPGALCCDGVPIRTVDRVKTGDTVSVELPERGESRLLSYTGEGCAPIVYEDGDFVVYDKPADMPVHPAKWHQSDTLANVFADEMAARRLSIPFRVLNRLDRCTSGLCVVAKNAHAAYRVGGRFEKTYTAVVAGVPEPKRGTVELPIARVDETDILRCVNEGGQRAVTHYEIVAEAGEYSALRIRLETGRTHQIRVHMSHIGHPLLGDERYGGNTTLLSSQALHCSAVRFIGQDGRAVSLVSSPPFWRALFPDVPFAFL